MLPPEPVFRVTWTKRPILAVGVLRAVVEVVLVTGLRLPVGTGSGDGRASRGANGRTDLAQTGVIGHREVTHNDGHVVAIGAGVAAAVEITDGSQGRAVDGPGPTGLWPDRASPSRWPSRTAALIVPQQMRKKTNVCAVWEFLRCLAPNGTFMGNLRNPDSKLVIGIGFRGLNAEPRY